MDVRREWKKVSKTVYHCGRFTVFRQSTAPKSPPWVVYWDDEYQGSADTLTEIKNWMKYRWKAFESMSGIRETKRPSANVIQ